MSSRDLPAQPDLDHLKHEAKALRRAFLSGAAEARARVGAVLGDRSALKLTEAQRVLAREYGFASWARLRTHVLAARGHEAAVNAFLAAIVNRDSTGARAVLDAAPHIASTSVHVAAALGRPDDVRRLLDSEPAQVRTRVGPHGGDPLLWLCYSPFHGESRERDDALLATARVLLEHGADPNTRDDEHGVPALYAVTGVNHVIGIARLLLDAGAEPTDGESLFHAAEQFHVDALELLIAYGADVNARGDWGNTPLYYLLRYWDVALVPRVRSGFDWLLEHGADPNVPCGREQETALHVAARRGQHGAIVRALLDRGADVHARRGDRRTAWTLASRAGHDGLVQLLERAGAEPQPLSAQDRLMAACGRGDVAAAARLASADLLHALDDEDRRLLPRAAAEGRLHTVRACLAAGFPVDTVDEIGAAALHHAAIHGRSVIVRELLRQHASYELRDAQHVSRPLGWAFYGADYVAEPDGDYADTVAALLAAGARPAEDEQVAHPGVRAVLQQHGPAHG